MFPLVTAVANKAQMPVNPTQLGLCWDVLSGARTGVTRIGQSGDDTRFEEPKHMQWHSVAHSACSRYVSSQTESISEKVNIPN